MRPPEFTGGNPGAPNVLWQMVRTGFNEAAGIHRRKHNQKWVEFYELVLALQ